MPGKEENSLNIRKTIIKVLTVSQNLILYHNEDLLNENDEVHNQSYDFLNQNDNILSQDYDFLSQNDKIYWVKMMRQF